MITPMIIKFDKERVKRFHEKFGYQFSTFNTFSVSWASWASWVLIYKFYSFLWISISKDFLENSKCCFLNV